MLPADKSSSIIRRISYVFVGLTALIWNAINIAAHVAFFMEYISINLNESLFALIGVIGGCGVFYVGASAFILRYKMAIIFDQLSDIYESGKRLQRAFFSFSHLEFEF